MPLCVFSQMKLSKVWDFCSFYLMEHKVHVLYRWELLYQMDNDFIEHELVELVCSIIPKQKK